MAGAKRITGLDTYSGDSPLTDYQFEIDKIGLLESKKIAATQLLKTLVSANDDTRKFLEDAIVAGSGIVVTVLNDGANETISISLAASVMQYKGTWNATTNTPTLVDGTGDTADWYYVSVSGTQNLGSGAITFGVGDWVVYNGTIWQKADNTDAVTSVNTGTGAITISGTNGLTTTGTSTTSIKMGGVLTENTDINLVTFTFNVYNSKASLYIAPTGLEIFSSDLSDHQAKFATYNGVATIYALNNSGTKSILFSADQNIMTVTQTGTGADFKANADYSSNYTDYSYISKAEADKRIVRPLDDITALKAFVTTDIADKSLIFVETLGLYRFDKTSTLTSDDNLIITPTTGGGRWILNQYTGNRYNIAGGLMPLSGVKMVRAALAGSASGNNDVYTCPANKRAYVNRYVNVYNANGSSVDYYVQVKVSSTYYRLSATASIATLTAANTAFSNASGFVLEAGETIAINTNNTDVNAHFIVYEFDNTQPLRTVKNLALASGNNTLYTVPTGYMAMISSADDGFFATPAEMRIVNGSGVTVNYIIYNVPSGGSPAANNTMAKATQNTLTATGISTGSNLAAGDSIVVNSDNAASGQVAWFTIWELPVSL